MFSFTPGAERDLAYDPSGKWLAYVGSLETGTLRYSLPEEPGSIWWVAWSPDGEHIAVSRSKGEVAIWNLQAVEAQLAKLGLNP